MVSVCCRETGIMVLEGICCGANQTAQIMFQTLDKALTPLAWATIIALVILSVFIS